MKRNDKTIAALKDGSRRTQHMSGIGAIASLCESMVSGMNGAGGMNKAADGAADDGNFSEGSYANHAGTRNYRLYIPGVYTGQPLPLIVMLHGCMQDPDDFAAGTGMNAMAEERQCFVLYPAQSESANGSRCWNWFDSLHQRRNLGEPSIIAGMTRKIINTYRIDRRRVFIAGLSSGGAMSAIMGTTYPDLYAAVGIHSGLPYASARNLSSALAVMKGGSGAGKSAKKLGYIFLPVKKTVPTIVFHGDRDTTVHPSNGDQIIEQSVSIAAHNGPAPESEVFPYVTVGLGKVANGHSYTHSVHRDHGGRVIAEQWIVHGAGHAWSGGSRRGSFTDAKGPNAAKEMLRFFLAHA